MKITALDFETYLIRHLALSPKWVCGSFYDSDGLDVRGNHPEDGLYDRVLRLLVDEDRRLVTHNGASFDLNVITANHPELIPLVFDALAAGRVSDTKIREKLLVIGDQGNMRLRRMPNGSWANITYDLATLEVIHLGVKDRRHEKGKLTREMTDGGARGDAWRFNFDSLDGMKASDYPEEAYDYAAEDARNTLQVYWAQESKFQSLGINARAAESLHVASGYCLHGMASRGMRLDPEAVGRLRVRLEHDLGNDSKAIKVLVGAGILRPATPSMPYANGAQEHAPTCPRNKKVGCACPFKMKAAEKASVCKANLHALIEQVCEEHDLPVKRTDETDKGGGGNVSADGEVLDTLKGLHPVIDAHAWRQNLLGLQDRELPRMTVPLDQPQIVHCSYNELMVTGRTSASASANYPSGNIQNVDPRVRECYIPRDGYLYLSVDYSGMELVTLAQTIFTLLGHSSLRDQINAGIEPHAFLGAQIAHAQASEFRDACQRAGYTTREGIYDAFVSMKKAGPAEAEFFKLYRTLAKPTGLGYPGGLGPKTFVALCKAQYGDALAEHGVVVDMDQAVFLRDLWFEVYPEMRQFFDIVKGRRDGANDQIVIDKVTKQPVKRSKFWYTTPMGMRRNGCSFTEAANGCALQSPGAELAKMGLVTVCRAAWDYSQESIMYRRLFPVAFIHDEVLSEVLEDLYVHEVATEKVRLMVEGGQRIVPDVKLAASPSLMRRWRKDAEPVYKDGRLAVWEPEEMLV